MTGLARREDHRLLTGTGALGEGPSTVDDQGRPDAPLASDPCRRAGHKGDAP